MYLIDEPEGTVLSRLYPLDKTSNAEGKRRTLEATSDSASEPTPEGEIAPLLHKLIEEHRATGLPPAYLPKTLQAPEEEKA